MKWRWIRMEKASKFIDIVSIICITIYFRLIWVHFRNKEWGISKEPNLNIKCTNYLSFIILELYNIFLDKRFFSFILRIMLENLFFWKPFIYTCITTCKVTYQILFSRCKLL